MKVILFISIFSKTGDIFYPRDEAGNASIYSCFLFCSASVTSGNDANLIVAAKIMLAKRQLF